MKAETNLWASTMLAMLLACGLLPGSWVIAVDFNEIARFNLTSLSNANNPKFIGSYPSAVAWNGSRLFVAGHRAGPRDVGDVGMIEVLSATSTGSINAPNFSARFRVRSFTPGSYGYVGLDLSPDGSSLVATYVDGGQSGFPGTDKALSMINTSDYSPRWSWDLETSGAGAAFDPGFNQGVGAGVAFIGFNETARILFDTMTGVMAPTPMNWYGGGGIWPRDMDFDPVTGDIYVRHSNQLSKATRTAANGTSNAGLIVNESQADLVLQQS